MTRMDSDLHEARETLTALSIDEGDANSSSTASEDESWTPDLIRSASTASTIRRRSYELPASNRQSVAANLPSELIIEIFKFLPTSRDLYSTLLTCRSWCACSVEMLWYKPLLFSSESLLRLVETFQMENQSFKYATFVRRLNLTYLADQVTDTLIRMLQPCRRLDRLTLVNCKNITDRGLSDILARNTDLVALDVTNLEEITDIPLHVAASKNKNLQGLNLSGCPRITDDAVTSIALSCKQLRRLKLNHCIEIRDRSVDEIARNCKYLLEIDLDHCHQVTSTSVSTLIRECLDLRELRLNMCGQIDDHCFAHMEKDKYVNMRSLDLTGCSRITDDSVYHIVTAAPKLRTLVLAKCPNITDRGAVQIARLGKNIHFLHLGHCSQLTDRCIGFLTKYCNRLRYIDLACCVQLTDHAVAELANLPRLKRIGLVKCSEITQDGILALLSQNTVQHTLERIHLSYCTNLGLDCIRALLNACRRLTHISLTSVPAFLQHEFTQFCRPSPRDFTPAQASLFCVFSAGGVIKLRNHLNDMYDTQLRENLTAPPSQYSASQADTEIVMPEEIDSMFNQGQHRESQD